MKQVPRSRRWLVGQLLAGSALLAAACAAPAASPTAAPKAADTPKPAPATAPAKPTAAAATQPAAKPAAAATQAPATPKALEKATVRMDFALLGYHAPFFYGKAKGYYAEEGIDLTIQPGQGSVSVAQQIAARPDETPFGFIVGDAVVRAVAQGAKVRMVSNLLPKGSNAVFYFKESGITSLKDLEGRSLGDIPGGFSYQLMDVIFDRAGVDKSKVQRVSLEVAAKNQTFLQKRVDTITGPTYLVPQLEAFANEPIGSFPFTEFGISYIGHGLASHADLIQSKPNFVRGMVKATLRAVRESKENPAAALEVFAKEFPEQVRGGGGEQAQTEQLRLALELTETPAMRGHPLGYQAEEDWRETVDLVSKYGGLQGSVPPVNQLYTNDMLPK